MKTLVVTKAGLAAAMDAKEQNIKIKLTHIGFGTEGYTPTPDQIELKAEFLKEAFQRSTITANQLHLEHSFKDADQAFEAKEIGYYLEDGTLFAVDSRDGEIISYKSKGTMLTEAFDLVLSGELVGAVTVEIKDDLVIYSNPNLFINGCFSVNQRYGIQVLKNASDLQVNNRIFFSDRWYLRPPVNTGGTTTYINEIMSGTVASQNGGTYQRQEFTGLTGIWYIGQRVELSAYNASDVLDKDVTVTFRMVKTTAMAFSAGLVFAKISDSSALSPYIEAPIELINETREFVTYSVTLRTPATLSESVHMNNLALQLELRVAGTNSTPQNLTPCPDGILSIYSAKAEWGDTATPFAPDNSQVNLARCQHYYQRSPLFMRPFAVGETATAFTSDGNENWRFANLPTLAQKRSAGAFRISDQNGALGKIYNFGKGASVTPNSYALNHVSGVASFFVPNGFLGDEMFKFSWEFEAEI